MLGKISGASMRAKNWRAQRQDQTALRVDFKKPRIGRWPSVLDLNVSMIVTLANAYETARA
jgi:hypothetical protein